MAEAWTETRNARGRKKQLTFGYLYDFRRFPGDETPAYELYAQTLGLIEWTESIGFAGAWIPEHHGAPDGYQPAPMLIMSAIAARTKSMKLGTGIALAPLYHPVRFAEECAVLDILSDGRLEMALGIGYRKSEYDGYGLDFRRRGARFDEFLQIVRRLWAGEQVSFAGDHYTIERARIMPCSPRGQIPLFLGGFSDKALERAARQADGYLGVANTCELYLEKVRITGKDPWSASVRVPGLFFVVANDPEEAMEELAPYYHYVNNSYGIWAREDGALGLDDPVVRPLSLDDFKTSGILEIVTPREAVAKFKALREQMPIDHFMMMLPAGCPPNLFAKYATIFAKEVIPHFAN